jgi:hypothetical protein
MVGAGCGASPAGTPLTAQQILDRAQHSKMQDAAITIGGALDVASAATTVSVRLSGSGTLVAKPAPATHLGLTVTLTGLASGTVTVDEIAVGTVAYTRTTIDIAGLPTTNSGLYTSTSIGTDQDSFVPQHASNLQVVGEDTIRGDKCWHLSGTTSTKTGQTSASVDFSLWVRESDAYIARVQLSSLPGLNVPLATPLATKTGSTSATANLGFVLDLSDYDQGRTVTPPPPDQIQS